MDENKFYALDLDRTLIDTSKCAQLYIDQIRELLGDSFAEEVLQQMEETEADGVSFDLLDAVQDIVGAPELVETVNESFVRSLDNDVLLPGAKELITRLGRKGLLTYGNPEWQALKIRAANIELPAVITRESGVKSKVIASWRADDGFVLPEEYGAGSVKEVVLIDDKISELEDLPKGSSGYWFSARWSEVPLPSNVKQISSLDEIME